MSRAGSAEPAVAVVLASADRPQLLGEVISDLQRQTAAFSLVLSVPDERSLPRSAGSSAAAVVHGRGLATQRNAGLDAVPDDAIVFFFDDDAVVRDDYIRNALDVFAARPDVVALTGRVLLDGATGPGIDRAVAADALRASAGEPPTGRVSRWDQLYGCNFAYRRSAASDERFDDRLPLYSWLEDHDFARRLLRHGAIVRAEDCVIVHRGVTSGGRTAHERLGYSQVMNPLYLRAKGSFPTWLTVKETVPRCGKNLVLSLVGPERSWRRRRLRGNLSALADALRGRLEPERMLLH